MGWDASLSLLIFDSVGGGTSKLALSPILWYLTDASAATVSFRAF